MSEFILKVDDVGAAAQIIKMFGIEETRVYGYHFTGEEIVRCRDCVHCYEDRRNTAIGWVDIFVCDSKQWSTSSLMPSHTIEPDGFCAWASRREGAES